MFLKSDSQYYEVIEKLKSEDEGFNEHTFNYQDVIVSLYNQKQNALKSLEEITYYMKQIDASAYNQKTSPVESIKVN